MLRRLAGAASALAIPALLTLAPGACGGSEFRAGAADADGGASSDTGTNVPNDGAAGDGEAGVCNRFALKMNGQPNPQWATVPYYAALDDVGQLTVEAWINPTSNTEEIHIASHHDYNTTSGWVLMLMTGHPEFRYDGAGQHQSATGNLPVSTNQWHHIAGTFDGTKLAVFLDGAQLDTTNVSYANATPTNVPFRIGAAAYAAGFGWKGQIDEVRLSKSVRYSGSYTVPTGPFAADDKTFGLWHLDEGTGQTLADSSGGGHNGFLGTTPNAENMDPAWVYTPCFSELRDR